MTSQLVLMNSNGISIASDSAVTVGGTKTFNSVNKIIPLDTTEERLFHKVAFMISGTANFISSGQNWPHVIWRFEQEVLAKKTSEPTTLAEYADLFVTFIKDKKKHDNYSMNDDVLAFGIAQGLHAWLSFAPITPLPEDKAEAFEEKMKEYQELRQKTLGEVVSGFVASMPEGIQDTSNWKSNQKNLANMVHSMLCTLIEGLDEIDEAYVLVCGMLNQLLIDEPHWIGDIVKSFIPQSTVCIMGYGSREHYPSLIRLDIVPECTKKSKSLIIRRSNKIVSNRAIEDDESSDEDTSLRKAFMLPFAQKEEMQTLFNGVRADYRSETMTRIHTSMETELPELLANELMQVPQFGEKTVVKALRTTIPAILPKVIETIRETFHKTVIKRRNKMRDSVSSLPIKELNEFSKMMVEIEARIKYYTESTRSVGGDIDVAQITLESGFEWKSGTNSN